MVEFETQGRRHYVREPDLADRGRATRVHDRVLAESRREGLLGRDGLLERMLEDGRWDQRRDDLLADLDDEIERLEGHFDAVPEQDRLQVALELRRVRLDREGYVAVWREGAKDTAEGRADDALLATLVISCLCRFPCGRALRDMDDFVRNENGPHVVRAKEILFDMMLPGRELPEAAVLEDR